jgi:tetratricopeptide (TPR) repeat protein
MSRLGRIVSACLGVLLAPAAGRAADGDVAAKAAAVLKAHCHRCHGLDGANEGGFNYALDRRQLVNRGKVVPGDPAKSKLFKRLTSEDDPMPPEEEKPRPTADDIAAVKRWIEAGAPDFAAPPAQRKALTPADVAALVAADLRGFAERDRRFARYFTLAHLHNAGLAADELQSYRHGLAKLVNSLSWGPRVVVPKAIGPAAAVFRIDLRDYQWDEATWDAVLALNPYGVALDTDAAKFATAATRCRLPCVRGDWFVAAAARPPLYHDVLKLPETDRDLERLLRVDVTRNIRQERVARAGFNGSGVSRNNRLIERHEAGAVVYWKSYDFLANTGRQNLFARPLGPGGDEGHFRHDGGEIIFNLPNGLQAYLLVDGAGRRIDKGPTSVVSDPKRPDRAVENGLSCMSCHAKGMIEKDDQVRAHVLKNPGAFAEADLETVKALYMPAAQMRELIRKDAKRFQEAVAKTGAPLTATEPVAVLALRFEAELDLPLAAAEAGGTPADLLAALQRSPGLAKQLGPLKVDGGTVQRAVFVEAFPDLVAELRAGTFIPSRAAEVNRLIRAADVLLEKGDAAGALAGYEEALKLDPRSAPALNNRGLANKRRGELDRAVADFTEALRLDPTLAAAFHNRGAALQAQGKLDRAIADYTEALRLDPTSPTVLNNRGYAGLEAGHTDEALADFNEALRLRPRFSAALNNRGLTHARKDDPDKAIADFSAAIALDPKFAKAYWNRSVAHEAKGDDARAQADRRRARELDPSLDE